jgi:glycosyltransferase involved in cell wall biosynthesis
MRLALISRRYPPLIGGAEKVVSYLAAAIASEGVEVDLLTARPPGLDLPKFEHISTQRGRLAIHRLSTTRLRFAGTWLYMRNLQRWLETHPPDLAYVSMLKHDAYVAVDVGLRFGFPVVLRPEGAGATGDLAWQKWGRFGQKIREQTKRADAFVVISKAIREELVEAGYDPARLHDLPNGVPIPEPIWQRRTGWRAAPRAIYVGRLAPEKGLETLIAAWAIVRRHWPTAQLTLVGDGPQRPTLEAGVSNLGLGDAIDFCGTVSDATPLLRSSDLFILPSQEEGMSIALLEAMALGMPIVATNIPGNRRLIIDFKNGRLIPPNAPESLARAIMEQWADFDRAFHMSRFARQRVERDFSIQQVARIHIQLFSELIAGRVAVRG